MFCRKNKKYYFAKKWGCHGTPGTPGVDGPELHKHVAKRHTGADASLQFMKTHRFPLIQKCLAWVVWSSTVSILFSKNDEILGRHFFCMNKLCSCRTFFLAGWHHMHCKSTTEISSIYWNVLLWIFSDWLILLFFFILGCYKINIYIRNIKTVWKIYYKLSNWRRLLYSFYWFNPARQLFRVHTYIYRLHLLYWLN